ncbi:MAG: UDP-2,3-diacylglucosamine diphosphatase LpxI [Puniceicoccales bacterium]|jgi:DUF1009 family protein|nr:UDP-2,3-diacylglucosamine diphosphatase LpxI [Puniceicoccales bacterium]
MHLSKFLPEDFDPTDKVVLLAGKGDYPKLVWHRFLSYHLNAYIIAFEGDAENWINEVPEPQKTSLNVGQIGKLLKTLKQVGARYVFLAGQINPSKLFHGLKLDLMAVWLLARLKEKNASTIFGSIVYEIEKLGITVLDARSFLDDQLIDKGIVLGDRAVEISEHDLQQGILVAKTLSSLDVGQGVVICQGTIVAVEAFEGTNAMLERAGTLCQKPMGFIKLAKNKQDFRFDVPVFGLRTLEKMKQAGIAWVALEGEKTLILNQTQVLEQAKSWGIKLIGF